eukprot:TRINITY_DN1173_c0_g1_i18.p1 TRINITY_DN1173_c0_g1~~TRINITY_DN1173_c0_g1_i18.p1  ORF type:complete len:157 (+),score=22.47 TRINITY_DN1173_c0_g1_i18:214-684(+)
MLREAKVETVFVTGGSGFVGRALLQQLVADGHEVISLGRSNRACSIVESLGGRCIKADFMDPETFPVIQEALSGVNTVYHLAAKVDIEGPLSEFRQLTIESTSNMLKWSKEKSVKNFVYCSTEQVLLGGPTIMNADETWPYPKPEGSDSDRVFVIG